ncbi:MAG: CRISPR-associated helicase Cas3' [Bacteroides fragilis]|nr:CRISPR-associated helicase Cas3' [Bacteroides fragilis]
MIAHISEDGLSREETVAEHTEKTVFLCGNKGKRCGISRIMSLCAIFHDMGKNKRKFDEYIRSDEKTRQKQRGSVAHASTGAKNFYDRYHEGPGNERLMTELISYTVAAHHGLFDCVNAEHEDVFSRKLGEVEDYDEACRNASRSYLDNYKPDEIFFEASKEFDRQMEKIQNLYGKLKPLLLAKHGEKVRGMLFTCKYFLQACLQRLLLSILIDSDWEATSDFMDNVDTLSKQPGFDTKFIFTNAKINFETYMETKRKSVAAARMTGKEKVIFNARNALQEECRQFAGRRSGIYCLPIPTGGGKTLTSLAYALEYCNSHPETERVIYVSPYISITEQNAQVFREALGNDRWILEHHSSVLCHEDAGTEDYHKNRLSRFDINWEEPFICTTFVQFMNTLFSDRSESIRRMHRLVNAVVIIDEIQSMPFRCINTFNYMMNFLNAVCNTNIVLCTATQPILGETQCPICYSEPKYMIRNAAEWFRVFERVQISVPEANTKYTFESLGNEIVQQITEYRSILVVLNTKSAVRNLYDLLMQRGICAEYLTTNLCAEHRSERIKTIKAALVEKSEPLVVISTNLIEAGVDISFECVYRSMAGLDSLAQTAGRCNRDGEADYGIVRLIWLDGENSGNMEELQNGIRAAEEVLYQYEKEKKKDSLLAPIWMDRYYESIYSMMADKMNFPIKNLDTNVMELLSRGFGSREKKNAMNQAYKTAGQAYKVIDDSSFGVIVPYGKGAALIEAIQKAAGGAEIRNLIKQAQRYTVNVRSSLLRQYDGLIQPICDSISGLYMAVSGIYSDEYGIAPEWETLIF